jgi:acyl transferase domain-containing protein/NAD(P)-dependent dehydrogenase (short-subunit alcohol dehydrogenase family)
MTTDAAPRRFKSLVRHSDLILRDHRVHGVRVIPGVTFIDLVYRVAAHCGLDAAAIELGKLLFQSPLATNEAADRELRLTMTPADGHHLVEIESRPAGAASGGAEEAWTANARCELRVLPAPAAGVVVPVEALKAQAREELPLDDVYALVRSLQIEHGPFMKTEGRVFRGDDYVLAEVRLGEAALAARAQFRFHPALLDSATLPFAALIPGLRSALGSEPFVPIYVERFAAHGVPGDVMHVLVRQAHGVERFADVLYNDIAVCDEAGQPLLAFRRLGAKRIRNRELIQRHEAAAPGPRPEAAPTNGASHAPAVGPLARDQAAEAAAPPATREFIEADLAGMVAAALGKDRGEIQTDAGFYDLGLESTDLLKLVKRLEAKIGAELYPTLLFEYGSIASLAEYLFDEHGARYGRAAVPPAARAVAAGDAEPAPPASDTEPAPLRFYQPVWKPSLARRLAAAAPATARGILVVAGPAAQAEPLAEALRAGGAGPVAVARFEGSFTAVDDGTFVLPASDAAAWGLLFATLRDRGGARALVHVGGLAEGAVPAGALRPDEAALARALGAGFESTLACCQAALALPPRERPSLLCLGRGLANPEQAAIAAFVRTARLEHPRLDLRCVQIDERQAAEAGALARIVEDELVIDPASSGGEIAYLDGARRCRALTPAAPFPPDARSRLRQGGVYLISGGAGGIGLLLARHLTGAYGARVVLVGRTEPTPALQRQVEALCQGAGRALYVRADVTRYDELRQALRIAKTAFKRLDGVFHCAGVTHDEAVARKDPADARATLAPKVLGTLNLDHATRDDDLDLFVLFSSFSAVAGNPGQSDYAFANAFMDEFAARRRRWHDEGRRQGVTLSVNWPLWQEGGMDVTDEVRSQLLDSYGLRPLETGEALAVLEGALAADAGQIAVVPGGSAWLRRWLESGGEADAPAASARAEADPRPVAPPPAARRPPEPTPRDDGDSGGGEGPLDAVAIIGMSGRYPGAPDLRTFWDNLRNGRDCITPIPAERWDDRSYFAERRGLEGKHYCRWGGFLDGVDEFDPLFFNVSPQEAETMDPQERLFLQASWQAIEDAGYTRARLAAAEASRPGARGKVGVFAGVMWSEYHLLALEESWRGRFTMASSSPAMIANRVSYALNLHGPSVPIDTMCSSSLMALHLACESLRDGTCAMALAGGVNLSLHPSKYVKLCQMQMLSPRGRCQSFGAGADGYVPGEGVGCLLLKPLRAAVADGDHIYAVVRGSSVNHGGRTAGLTVPSPVAQAEVIAETFRKTGVSPRSVSYVEAHGTGTALGDPIEIAGLTRAFSEWTADRQFCAVGSVKSNVGHLEAAAGIAAVTKVVLQLVRGQIAPSLHAQPRNPKLDLEATPFHVADTALDWSAPRDAGVPRRATVSSFGAGGVNVHMLIEEAPAVAPAHAADAGRAHLIVLSARKPARLRAYVERLRDFLHDLGHTGRLVSLGDLAHTLGQGREPMAERLAVVATDRSDLSAKLTRFLAEGPDGQAIFAGSARARLAASGDSDTAPEGSLAAAARRWIEGGPFEPEVARSGRARFVPAPTYPFAPERHWFQTKSRAGDGPDADTPAANHRLTAPPPAARGRVEATVTAHLAAVVARELKIAADDLDPEAPLADYGLDSVMAMKILSRLEATFGDLPPTLLLELQTIAAFARHLVEHRWEPSSSLLDDRAGVPTGPNGDALLGLQEQR